MHLKLISAAMAAVLGVTAAYAQAPVANPHAPANAAIKDSDVGMTSTAAKGANSFTEAQARERIAKAGFTHISDLTKDDNGLWQGTAMKHKKSMNISLDYKGNVTAK